MDPSRLTTMAEVSTVPMDSEHCYITDVLSYNHYFGWYCGTVADNGPWFDAFHEKNPDRAIRKDAFYIYQAYWSDKPMIHVCGERFPDRGPEERQVIIYTNCPSVTLLVNGKEVASKEAADHAAVFKNVPLQDGDNTVTAVCGSVQGNTIRLNTVETPNSDYVLKRGENDIPVGNWFDGQVPGTDDDHTEFPEGFYSVKDTVADVMAIENGKLLTLPPHW